MLAPLDERIVRSLVTYDEEVECRTCSDPRNAFGKNCVSGGLQFIFDRFHLFWAVLDTPGATGGAEWPDPPYWAIEFRERPWKHLTIRPDPADKTSCRVFEDERYIKTYKMLGCPEHWVDLVRWLWDYGNRRAIAIEAMHARRKVKKNRANPAFSLPARRPSSRNKHRPPPPPPSRAHPASHVLQRTGLRPHQGIKGGGKRAASPLSTMTLASIQEDTHVEGQVSEEAVPEDCLFLQEKDAYTQKRASPLGTMKLANIKEDSQVQGHVLKAAAAEDCDVLQERDVNMQKRASPLSTMILASVKEDTYVEGRVSKKAVPEHCDALRERDVNRQRVSQDSPKGSTIENVKLGDTGG